MGLFIFQTPHFTSSVTGGKLLNLCFSFLIDKIEMASSFMQFFKMAYYGNFQTYTEVNREV